MFRAAVQRLFQNIYSTESLSITAYDSKKGVISNGLSGIFPSTFVQLINRSKNSILNWVLKLNLFMFFEFFFLFWKPLKYFSFYSPILYTFRFRSLQTCIKEDCMYFYRKIFSKFKKINLPKAENLGAVLKMNPSQEKVCNITIVLTLQLH